MLLAVLANLPSATGIGIDRSQDALEIAARNAEATGLGTRAEMRLADWDQPDWTAALGQFDLILANPPYVEEAAELDPSVRAFEPAVALFAGAEGLDAYRVLIPQLRELLKPDGAALIEIGYTQAEPVAAIAKAAGFESTLHHDLGGRPRVLELQIPLGKADVSA